MTQNKIEQSFFDRADEIINVANAHLSNETRGKVSASTLYAAARFNAWISATGFENGQDMSEAKSETISYFVEQYRKMLTENLDDYIAEFDNYMKPR